MPEEREQKRDTVHQRIRARMLATGARAAEKTARWANKGGGEKKRKSASSIRAIFSV